MNTTVVSNHNLQSSTKWWNILLWLLQGGLFVMFGMAGIMKLTTPIAELSQVIPWSADVPLLVRFIGLSEVLGAVGLLLPSLTRIKPQLTVLAAGGLALVMILAIVFHLIRGEVSAIGINLLLGGVAAFIAWGRVSKASIQQRV